MAHTDGTTPQHQPEVTGAPLADAIAGLDAPAQARLMKVLIIVAGVMLGGTLSAQIGLRVLAERAQLAPPTLSRVDLPAGQCGEPKAGDVLHITVAPNLVRGQDFVITCLNAGPRPQRLAAKDGK
jgi:hypothetical protein